MTGLWLLLATAVLVVVVGVALRRRSGQVRQPPRPRRPQQARRPSAPSPEHPIAPALPPAVLAELPDLAEGEVALLQLSTAFCAPCRHTRVLLADLAANTPGLHHVDVDVTDRPDLTGPLRVRSTPTTVAVDAAGRELLRLSGVPRRDALLDALRGHLRRTPSE